MKTIEVVAGIIQKDNKILPHNVDMVILQVTGNFLVGK